MIYGFSKEQQRKVQTQKLLALRDRLYKGWDICDKNPTNKEYEQHFLKLLKQYEQAARELAVLGGKEPPLPPDTSSSRY